MGFAIHHVQLAMPSGEEDRARHFYGRVLGLAEVDKPTGLASRGGVWFHAGGLELHLGVEADFVAARKAHPGILVEDLDAVRTRLEDAGAVTEPDGHLPGFRRLYAADCFGNRLEFLEPEPTTGPDAGDAGPDALDARANAVRVAVSDPLPEVVAAILADLPEWFGMADAVRGYVDRARQLPTYAAWRAGEPVGVLLLEHHSPTSSEIHLLAVDRAHHRRGIGSALLRAAEADARAQGRALLHVKTLGPSHPSPEYEATRMFYEAVGYTALQELPSGTVWSDNPCLLMAKPLRAAGR